MKRARKVSNIHGEIHFQQKQRLTIVFTGNTLPHRKRAHKGADFIVDKIACHQHVTNKTELPYDAPKKPY